MLWARLMHSLFGWHYALAMWAGDHSVFRAYHLGGEWWINTYGNHYQRLEGRGFMLTAEEAREVE